MAEAAAPPAAAEVVAAEAGGRNHFRFSVSRFPDLTGNWEQETGNRSYAGSMSWNFFRSMVTGVPGRGGTNTLLNFAFHTISVDM